MKCSMDLEQMKAQSLKLTSMMGQIREAMLAPTSRKASPVINSTRLAELCKLTKQGIYYKLSNNQELPAPAVVGSKKEWSGKDAASWVRQIRSSEMRPKGKSGVTIAIANFKGGVTKTTTAVTLAQGLSMRGHRVLFLDLDPQGSATNLFGILPDTDVSAEATALDIFSGKTDFLDNKIQSTYWDGIDLIPASPALFAAEYEMPRRQAAQPLLNIAALVHDGLTNARQKYDVIVIDTPPSLSFLTVNALLAADGLIMPIPPSSMDFASSTQFWSLLTEILRTEMPEKAFAFVNILLSRVDSMDASAGIVRGWISSGYSQHLMPAEIPKTSASTNASAGFGTIYDLAKGDIDRRTLQRARESYDGFVESIMTQLVEAWS